ncbi:hypothetical protein GOBAR_AA38676 [Gossypium barbadense]|uniref:SGNH hydrolase-type esterase domain-containing protein n=1 Tax=Gossypium barbadense TaxID=3634 RepID=A0A2P5VT71_GOSBA|nr:hypothetical protein GOBAR_AA38676 [Gossypium barbadense]
MQIPKVRATVPAIIVFGDSTVDPGNNNQVSTVLKSNFEPYGRDYYGGQPTGRFSNGRIATDFISEALRIKPAIPAYLDPKATVPAIIVFGDSTVDPGNNNQVSTVLKSNFEPYGRDYYGGQPTGRFSNGRIATDFISEALRIKPAIPAYLDPKYDIEDFATGVSFASAGTGYDNATSDVLVSRATDW